MIPDAWKTRLRTLGVFFFVFGARLWLVSRYGNAVPYWDQWDAEADLLLRPVIHGSFPWKVLFAAHNEHRIFFTRLVTLLLFHLNRQWDPLLEMAFNAALAAVCASVLYRILCRLVSPSAHTLIACAVAAVFSLPFGWENTLAGFQSQFFFLELFSFIAIAALLNAPPLSTRWGLGAIAGLAACFSMASGFFSGAAVIVAWLFGVARSGRWPPAKQFLTLAAALLIVIVGILARTTAPGHSSLIAQSPHAFLFSLESALAWPSFKSRACALILWLPSMLLLVKLLRDPKKNRAGDLLVGLISWVVLQAVAIAYARGGAGSFPVSRYMDSLACGLLFNLVALILLHEEEIGSRYAHTIIGLAWMGFAIAGLGHITLTDLYYDLPLKRQQTLAEEKSVRDYVATRDLNALRSKKFLEIPYPTADRLASLLDDAELRDALPFSLHAPIRITGAGPSCFAIDGIWSSVPRDPLAPAWGSFGTKGTADVCTFKSDWFEPKSRYVTLELAGYLGADQLHLTIQGQQSSVVVQPHHAMHEHWEPIFIRIPTGPVRIVAEDANPNTWFAFRNLHALGPGTYFSMMLTDKGDYLCLTGILLFILAV